MKYTHITGQCNKFLKTGAAVRLKRHNYTLSAAYWRLRGGKGLISAYDQKTLDFCFKLITQIRRYLGSPVLLSDEYYKGLFAKKKSVIDTLEIYRTKLESGAKPEYLNGKYYTVAVNRVLFRMVNNRQYEMTVDEMVNLWKKFPQKEFNQEVKVANKIFEEELEEFNRLTQEQNKKALPPGFKDIFYPDCVWQIRTDFDNRCSIGAKINERLEYIWNIPNLTDDIHQSFFINSLQLVEDWKILKSEIRRKIKNKEPIYEDVHSIMLDMLDKLVPPELEKKGRIRA